MGDTTTDNHNLQEYTYKKITPCDVCSQVLRGEFERLNHKNFFVYGWGKKIKMSESIHYFQELASNQDQSKKFKP